MEWKDLKSYRDSMTGRIVLDNIVPNLPKKIELGGTTEKSWYLLDDCAFLVKIIPDGTFRDYAELLAEESYRFFGVETCEYDIATLNGRKAVITKDIRNKSEQIITGNVLLRTMQLISSHNSGYDDKIPEPATPYFNNICEIVKAMYYFGFSIEQIEKMTVTMYRVFVVSCFLLDADKHWKNWGILMNSETGGAKICPQFDSEAICRFKMDASRLAKYLKIAKRTKKDEYKYRLIYSDIFPKDFNRQCLLRYNADPNSKVGMEEVERALTIDYENIFPLLQELTRFSPDIVLKNVERKIGVNLPSDCKEWFGVVMDTNMKYLKELNYAAPKKEL